MSIVERIRTLCNGKNTTIAALERELEFGQGTIRKWDTNSPSVEKFSKVATFFNVSTDYLLGASDFKNFNTENMSKKFCLSETAIKNMEHLTRMASKDWGALLSDMLNALLENEKIEHLLTISLNHVLAFFDDDFHNIVDKLTGSIETKEAAIDIVKQSITVNVAGEYAKILLDIIEKGEFKTYYDITKTKDGWYAKGRNSDI